MSLELKIEELTKQVVKLTEIMAYLASNPAPQAEQLAPTAPVESVKAESVAAPTKVVSPDDVTALCLSLSRKDPANKVKIKELLSSYKALKVSDLTEANLAEFAAKLEQL